MAQGKAVIEYLGKRPVVKSNSLIGSVRAASKLEDTKTSLREKMSDAVRNVLHDYPEVSDEAKLMRTLRQIFLISATLEVAAVGCLVANVSGAIPVNPLVSSGFFMAGLLVLKGGNSRMSEQYSRLWEDKRIQLDEILESVCSQELKGVQQKILAGVTPYTRYVKAEEDRIFTMTDECEAIQAEAHALRNRIEKLRR